MSSAHEQLWNIETDLCLAIYEDQKATRYLCKALAYLYGFGYIYWDVKSEVCECCEFLNTYAYCVYYVECISHEYKIIFLKFDNFGIIQEIVNEARMCKYHFTCSE